MFYTIYLKVSASLLVRNHQSEPSEASSARPNPKSILLGHIKFNVSLDMISGSDTEVPGSTVKIVIL